MIKELRIRLKGALNVALGRPTMYNCRLHLAPGQAFWSTNIRPDALYIAKENKNGFIADCVILGPGYKEGSMLTIESES